MKPRTASSVMSLVLALAVAFTAAEAGAEPAKWDQKRVTAIAEKFAKAVADLRETVRKQPPTPNPRQTKLRYQALDDLRLLRQAANNLASDLKAGEGRAETYPGYKRIQLLRRDAEENGRKADIKEDTLARIAAAQDLLRQLAPYYEEEAAEVGGAPVPPAEPAAK